MQRPVSFLLVVLAWAGGAWATYDYLPGCPPYKINATIARRARPDQTLTYKIRVKNTGKDPLEHLYVEAVLPPYVVYPVPPKAGHAGHAGSSSSSSSSSSTNKPSYSIAPKKLTNSGVDVVGNELTLNDVTVPPRKTLTFKIQARVQNCVPEPNQIEFTATAFLKPSGGAQTCFLDAPPSTVDVTATKRATEQCPANVIAGAPIGAESLAPGVSTSVPLSLAPVDTFIATNNPAQDAVRAQQRAARAAWRADNTPSDAGPVEDPVVQPSSANDAAQATAALTFDYSVDAMPNNLGYTPPDPTHAVGPNHIVTMVNSQIAVYDKSTGAQVVQPKNTNTIFAGLPSTDPCRTRNDGDPMAAWDHWNQRFVVSQFTTASPYKQCIAVSKTADPTGAWWLYSITLSSNQIYDYPKLGVVRDAYVFTWNRFGGSYAGGAIMLLNSVRLANGQTPQSFIWLTQSKRPAWPVYGLSLLPGGSDNVKQAPPAGSAVPIAALKTTSPVAVYIMKLTWDFAAGKASITGSTNPWILSPAAFSPLCSTCVAQPGTTQRLDSLSDRLMNRMVYNHWGTYDTMVVTHSVSNGVRWYEIRNINTNGGTPTIYQQGTFPSPAGGARWFGTMAMDKNGNIGMGYAESGSSTFPSIGITGRLAGATLGSMTYDPLIVAAGAGSLTCTCARFGDYASMQVDPVDGCTFYLFHEYVPSTGVVSWRTRLVKFHIPGCA